MDCSAEATKIFVLKVNLHGPACEKKVHKLLRKINGMYSIVINGEYGKVTVTVSGKVEPCTLIMALEKVGKNAELLWEDYAPVNYPNQFVSGGVEAIDPEELQQFSKMERVKQVEVTKGVKVKFKNHEDEPIQKSRTIKIDMDDVHGPKMHHGYGPRGATTCSCHMGTSHSHETENNTTCHGPPPPRTCSGHATKNNSNHHVPPPPRTGCGYGYATENNNSFCGPPPPRTTGGYATENNNSFCRPPHPRTSSGYATENNNSFYGPPPPRTGSYRHENFHWCGSSRPHRHNSGPAEPPYASTSHYANCPPQPPAESYSYPSMFSDDNPHGCSLM